MTDLSLQLNQVLQDAEAAALRILAAAAASRDYRMIDRARSVAKRLGDLEVQAVAASPGGAVASRSSPRSGRRGRSRRAPAGDYPRFHVADCSLHKTGWSKKGGKEYIHRVPVERAEMILASLDRLATGVTGPVTVEQILESDEVRASGQIPAYQIYLLLAFLKRREIVTSIGREGYRLSPGIASQGADALAELERKPAAAGGRES